jgi:hypothetical protein
MKDEDGKESVDPKRKKGEACMMTRKLPEGCQIEAIAKDGNFLFAAVASALKEMGGSGAGDTHREVRGRCAAWMRVDKTDKYNSVYASAGMTKDQYIEKMSKGGTWGGAPEILCMCDFYQCSIFVVPMNHSSPIFRFGDQHASRKIALWYTGTHYDRLKPQEEHWNLMKSPTIGTVTTECTGGGDTPPANRAAGSGAPENRGRRRRVHSARADDRADAYRAFDTLERALATAAAPSPPRTPATPEPRTTRAASVLARALAQASRESPPRARPPELDTEMTKSAIRSLEVITQEAATAPASGPAPSQ